MQSYEDAVRISTKRFNAGLASYFEVIEAEIQLYPAQLALAQTELNQRVVIVQLYKVLGGGRNLTDAQWTSTETGAANPQAVQKP